jgi:hypothetical protein
MPSLSKVSTTPAKLLLNISGYVSSISSSLYELSVYNLKHFPGLVLPALPYFKFKFN